MTYHNCYTCTWVDNLGWYLLLVVTQDFDWPTLSNVTHEMARNHCLSMIEMSKVASVCVNVTGMADVLDLCIMEVKVSCNISTNLMLQLSYSASHLYEDEFILLKLLILCLNTTLKGHWFEKIELPSGKFCKLYLWLIFITLCVFVDWRLI